MNINTLCLSLSHEGSSKDSLNFELEEKNYELYSEYLLFKVHFKNKEKKRTLCYQFPLLCSGKDYPQTPADFITQFAFLNHFTQFSASYAGQFNDNSSYELPIATTTLDTLHEQYISDLKRERETDKINHGEDNDYDYPTKDSEDLFRAWMFVLIRNFKRILDNQHHEREFNAKLRALIEKDSTCSVLMTPLNEKNCCLLPCNHIFSVEAIKKIKNNTCPLCRATFYRTQVECHSSINLWD